MSAEETLNFVSQIATKLLEEHGFRGDHEFLWRKLYAWWEVERGKNKERKSKMKPGDAFTPFQL